MTIPPRKQPTSFRLPPYALRLLAQMAKGMGISKTDTMTMALRALAQREGFDK